MSSSGVDYAHGTVQRLLCLRGRGRGAAEGYILVSQAGVDVPDVVGGPAEIEMRVRRKDRRRAALDKSLLGGEVAGAGLAGCGADEVRVGEKVGHIGC